MQKSELYTKEGWINTDLPMHDKASFVLMIGGRGIGKTFGILRSIIDSGEEFIYMRRTQEQIDAIKIPELSPFKDINIAYGYNIVVDAIGKKVAGFYNSNDEGKATGATLGLAVALSTFSTIRGISSQAKYLIFDEFIPERHERPIKEEGTAFLNAIETINRNRELQDKPPIKVLLLSNSNDLTSPILTALGCTNTLDNMIRKRKFYTSMYDGALAIYRYIDSPISDKKRSTVLYRIAHNEDFSNMALANEFSAANYEHVKNEEINQYMPLVTIGDITIYKHKSLYKYYIVPGQKAIEKYTLLPLSVKQFKANYGYLWDCMIHGKINYATAPTKISFERLWSK